MYKIHSSGFMQNAAGCFIVLLTNSGFDVFASMMNYNRDDDELHLLGRFFGIFVEIVCRWCIECAYPY